MPVFIMLVVSVQVAVCGPFASCVYMHETVCYACSPTHASDQSKMYVTDNFVECAHTKLGAGVCMYITQEFWVQCLIYYIYISVLNRDHLYHLCHFMHLV